MRRAVVWVLFVVFVLIGGGMAIGGSVAGIAGSQRAKHETATVTGTVTAAGRCGKASTDGHATFTVNGLPYAADVPCNTHVGERVTIKYDPADPSHNNDAENYSHSLLVAGLGVLLVVIAVPSLVRELRRGPAKRDSSLRRGGYRPLDPR